MGGNKMKTFIYTMQTKRDESFYEFISWDLYMAYKYYKNIKLKLK